MSNDNNLFACFVSSRLGDESGKIFRSYIWGDKGIDPLIKSLNHRDYGIDLQRVLFQFYVNPYDVQIQSIKEVGAFRQKEKAIGVSKIVNDQNFFQLNHIERQKFIKQAIMEKVGQLKLILRNKKLDTNFDLLISDLSQVLS